MKSSNPLVVSGVQSISTIISAVDNLYSVDPGTVTKDPDLSKTSYSKKISDEEDLAFYAVLLPSPWKPVIYDSSGCVSGEGG